MNYNREPCRPVYTQQQATSSHKAYNLAFKRTAQYNPRQQQKRSMTLNLKNNKQIAYYAYSAR